MKEEKEYSFSTSHLLPLGFFLASFLLKEIDGSEFPLSLSLSSLLLFTFSCLWDFKGLFWSSLFSSVLILFLSPHVFQEFSSFLFFIISFNTGCITALFKKNASSIQRKKEETLVRLKAWESHYYIFRQQCLEEVDLLKKTQQDMIYSDLELQTIKQERLEEFLKEDEAQKILIDLLSASQEKCQYLEKEIEILEQIVLMGAPLEEKAKSSRKKKVKEESQQAFLFEMH